MINYKDIEYAKTRLAGTIVQRIKDGKKKAINIVDFAGDTVVHVIMSNGAPDQCPMSELDITPVPLGYVNIPKGTVYVARKPMRQDWRQGLRSNSAAIMGDAPYNFNNIPAKFLAACIEGVYPTYKQCVGKIVRNPDAQHSMAFSREFAIHKDGMLYYKTFEVGAISENGDIQYNPGLEWVDDTFREIANG